VDLERDSNTTITQGLLRLIGDRWLRRKQLRRRGEKTRRSRLSIFGKVQRKDDEGGFVRNRGLIGKLPHRRIFTALTGGIGSPASGFGEAFHAKGYNKTANCRPWFWVH
jgi:hypothetical protein